MMQRMAAQQRFLKVVNHAITKHTLMPLKGSAYLDHFSRQTGRTTPIRVDSGPMVGSDKLRAYVNRLKLF